MKRKKVKVYLDGLILWGIDQENFYGEFNNLSSLKRTIRRDSDFNGTCPDWVIEHAIICK